MNAAICVPIKMGPKRATPGIPYLFQIRLPRSVRLDSAFPFFYFLDSIHSFTFWNPNITAQNRQYIPDEMQLS